MDTKTELDTIALDILKDLLREQNQQWIEESKYRKVRNLQIDKRGSFEERFFTRVLVTLFPRRIEYNDGDQGDWDIMINKKKLEIKTSTLDVNEKFQNENIKKEGNYDGLLFLGIEPNQLRIKFVQKENINFSKLHNRGKRGTGANYKWDFKKEEYKTVNTLENIRIEFQKTFF